MNVDKNSEEYKKWNAEYKKLYSRLKGTYLGQFIDKISIDEILSAITPKDLISNKKDTKQEENLDN